MTTETREVYNHTWRRVRLRILERDDYLCQIKGPRCGITATSVDHIQPWRKGGALYAEGNLRASCRWCQEWAKKQSANPHDRRPSREW